MPRKNYDYAQELKRLEQQEEAGLLGDIIPAENVDIDSAREEIGEYSDLDLKAVNEQEQSLVEEENEETTDEIFTEYEYRSVPKIPEQYRASDVIGKRTQASSASNAIKIGPIKQKAKYRAAWNGMTCAEKYILMLISEHRHLTVAQLSVLIIQPSKYRMKVGCVNNTKSYYEFVRGKYQVEMNYKDTFKTQTDKGLWTILHKMCEDGFLEEITPAYSVKETKMTKRYKETPSLFTKHYYLTSLGAKILICNTAANMPGARENPVGFVPTYKNAAYQTILHEAETTEILCSVISCAEYASNPDDGKNYGLFDVCRFYHEKDVEEKNVVYKGKKIDFKTDGKLTMYVESVGDFIDWYIEYDSGSSTKDKIKHKTEAFIKYIFWKREQYGDRFRKPVLLLVTQKPADLFPYLTGRKNTTYTTGIRQMARTCFEEYLPVLNDIAIILIADSGSIRTHGALGACWHRLDLTTGIAEWKAYDLIAASCGISQGLDSGK